MKKGNLPIGWVRWRRRRYQRLSAQGLSNYIAWQVAAGEAKWRHRVSRIIGNLAARDAELACVSTDGQLRFTLSGDLTGLTEVQVSAIEELSREASVTA